MHRACCVAVCVSVIGVTIPTTSNASWPVDPAANLPICVQPGDQSNAVLAMDGQGGVFAVWSDQRGVRPLIYAQHVLAGGAIDTGWPANGAAICASDSSQVHPLVVADGATGFISAWEERSSPGGHDVYLQRTGGDGAAQWASNGIRPATTVHDRQLSALVQDGTGGAIAVWKDAGEYNVHVQRLSPDGERLWGPEGVSLMYVEPSYVVDAISDDSSGVIVFSMDAGYIFGERIDAMGRMRWSLDGYGIQVSPGGLSLSVTRDGGGGAIIGVDVVSVCQICDVGSSVLSQQVVIAQRVDRNGQLLWDPTGEVGAYVSDGLESTVSADGTGGAIFVMRDTRLGNYHLIAQRLTDNGSTGWALDGIDVSTPGVLRDNPTAVPDGLNGAIIAWRDWRSGGPHVYAQRVSATGTPLWGSTGVAVCVADGGQGLPRLIEDGAGGAIATWSFDSRNPPTGSDIYAQRMQPSGALGGTVAVDPDRRSSSLRLSFPNPARDGLQVDFALRSSELGVIDLLDVSGRTIFSRPVADGGRLSIGHESIVRPGVYFVRLRQGAESVTKKVCVVR